jgi:hypothetical protein
MKVIWQGDISYVVLGPKQTLRICIFDNDETEKGYPLGDGLYLQGFEASLGTQWFPMTEYFIRKLSPIDLIRALAVAAQSFTLSIPEPAPPKRKGGKKAAPNALELATLTPAEKLVYDALEACPSFAGRIRDLPAFVAAALEAFPRLDILHEIKQAHFWIVSNKDAAPKSKFDRFLNSWFSRANERLGPPSSPALALPIEEAPPTPRKPTGSPIREEIKMLASRPFEGPRDARALASRIGSGMLASPAESDQENE